MPAQNIASISKTYTDSYNKKSGSYFQIRYEKKGLQESDKVIIRDASSETLSIIKNYIISFLDHEKMPELKI
jgi:hypothetical protein